MVTVSNADELYHVLPEWIQPGALGAGSIPLVTAVVASMMHKEDAYRPKVIILYSAYQGLSL
jgi:hypothetical protein